MSVKAGSADEGYSIAAYVRDRLFAIVMAILFMCVMDMPLLAFGLGWGVAILMDCMLAAFVVVVFGYGYARQAAFFSDVAELSGVADSPDALVDVLPEPKGLESSVIAGALSSICLSSECEMSRLRREVANRKRYMELWVHEVKTPIATSALILDEMHGESASKLKYEVERISSYVDQALFYARCDSVASDYMIRELDLGDVVKEACKKNMRLLIQRGVSVGIELDSGMNVLADRLWLEFIISQVISNSAKYGSESMRFAAFEEGEGASARMVLEISDDGCGIPAEDVPRVFDYAFTGSVGRAHGSATGMGLYLVAIMCNRMGLGVELASEEGKGTRVMLSFPHDRRRWNLSRASS